MLELNKIYCETCFNTFSRFEETGEKVNIILTSPPYNTSYNDKNDKYHHRYGEYHDILTESEYIDMTISLFKGFETILDTNGVILYNLSYCAQNPASYINVIWNIINNTNFTLSDTIIWKKSNSLPDNASSNRLTRITEFVFVITRKKEVKTYQCNKKINYIGKGGHKIYNSIQNFIEAKNNDGPNSLNKATYSSELCEKLLNIFAKNGDVIYDPFMGTGTTAIACKKLGLTFIGSEIEQNQVLYANDRISKQCKNTPSD